MITVAILTVTSFSAKAADVGFYAGVDAGVAGYTSGVNSYSSTAFGITGGYQYNKYWSVESQYIQPGKFSGVTTTGVNAGKSHSSTVDATTLVAVGKYPVANIFSLYGKIGVANTNNNQNHSNGTSGNTSRIDGTYGLGGEYALNATTGIRLGWDRYIAGTFSTTTNTNGTRNIDTWTLGAVYKF